MASFFGVLLIILIVFGAFYLTVYQVVRVIGHQHIPHSESLPNGQTRERAARLERESENYRNVLVNQLIREAEERRRGR